MNNYKKIKILFALILISITCFGQKYFNNLYDYSFQTEGFNSVIQTADSGYLAVGTSKKNGIGYNYYVLRTDKKGSKVNEGYFEIPRTEIILSSIKSTNDSTFIACGIIIDQDSTTSRYNRDALLVKMDINGDTLWMKRFGFGIGTSSNPDFEAAHDIIVTKDNGFAILGYTSNSVSLGFQIYLIKTDSIGNLQWQKTYGGSNSDDAFTILETNDKGFVMSGYTLSYGAGDRDGYVIKTDSLGNFQWQETYGGSMTDGTIGICKSLEGGYLLSGWTKTNSSLLYQTKLWLVKIDNSGNQQWNKTFGNEKSYGEIDKVIQLSDSSYVCVGGIKDTIGMPVAGILLKTTNIGDSLWAREFKRSTTIDDYIYNFAPTIDGGFILTGFVSSSGTTSGTQDGWLIKTDCLGADSITYYFGDSCSIGNPTVINESNKFENSFVVYPNPTTEMLNVDISTSLNVTKMLNEKNVTIQLLNSLGQIILQKNVNTLNLSLNIQHFSSGIYFLQLLHKGQLLETKKIIKQ